TIWVLIGMPPDTLKAKWSFDGLEARIRSKSASDLGARPPVEHHDVCREVVGAPDQRRPDAVGVDRDAVTLEGADLREIEATGDDDVHEGEVRRVERLPHL